MSKSMGIRLPQHVAIVMDGNGRWATNRHKPRQYGHKQGASHAMDFVEMFQSFNIPYLTLYAFSTENWNRPRSEVETIINLLIENLDMAVDIAIKRNIRIKHLGRADRLSHEIQQKAMNAVNLTSKNSGLTVSIAFDYGGRGEIIDAVRRIIREKIPPDKIDEKLFSNYLYTADIPDPDLFIRTGGEMRLSNLLIWQTAYAELYFTPVLWPDFGKAEFEKALIAYDKRDRRFGMVSPL